MAISGLPLIQQGITLSNSEKMKIIHQIQSENFSHVFLYIAFMFVNINYVGLLDYLIKAILGAIVWYGFKFLHDYFSAKMHRKMHQQPKEQENKTEEKS